MNLIGTRDFGFDSEVAVTYPLKWNSNGTSTTVLLARHWWLVFACQVAQISVELKVGNDQPVAAMIIVDRSLTVPRLRLVTVCDSGHYVVDTRDIDDTLEGQAAADMAAILEAEAITKPDILYPHEYAPYWLSPPYYMEGQDIRIRIHLNNATAKILTGVELVDNSTVSLDVNGTVTHFLALLFNSEAYYVATNSAGVSPRWASKPSAQIHYVNSTTSAIKLVVQKPAQHGNQTVADIQHNAIVALLFRCSIRLAYCKSFLPITASAQVDLQPVLDAIDAATTTIGRSINVHTDAKTDEIMHAIEQIQPSDLSEVVEQIQAHASHTQTDVGIVTAVALAAFRRLVSPKRFEQVIEVLEDVRYPQANPIPVGGPVAAGSTGPLTTYRTLFDRFGRAHEEE